MKQKLNMNAERLSCHRITRFVQGFCTYCLVIIFRFCYLEQKEKVTKPVKPETKAQKFKEIASPKNNLEGPEQ